MDNEVEKIPPPDQPNFYSYSEGGALYYGMLGVCVWCYVVGALKNHNGIPTDFLLDKFNKQEKEAYGFFLHAVPYNTNILIY